MLVGCVEASARRPTSGAMGRRTPCQLLTHPPHLRAVERQQRAAAVAAARAVSRG